MRTSKIYKNIGSGNSALLTGITRSVQKNLHECGVRCTYMVLKYFGKVRSYQELYEDMNTTKEGVGPGQIIRTIRSKGLMAGEFDNRGVDKLKKSIDMGAPVIAWLYRESDIKKVKFGVNHWVVVYGYDRDNIWVMNPSPLAMRKCLPVKSFNKKWSGGGIVVRRKKEK